MLLKNDKIMTFLYYLVPTAAFLVIRYIQNQEITYMIVRKILLSLLILYETSRIACITTLQHNCYTVSIATFIFIFAGFCKLRIISFRNSFTKEWSFVSKRKTRIHILETISLSLLILLASFLIAGFQNAYHYYGKIKLENLQMVFNTKSSNFHLKQYKDIILQFMKYNGFKCLISTSFVIISCFIFLPFSISITEKHPIVNFTVKVHLILIIYWIFAVYNARNLYNESINSESDFFKDNFVKSEGLVSFNGKKRNIILIILESMESTFLSRKSGGFYDRSLIPQLENIANCSDSVHFSDKKGKMGGAFQFLRTSYTGGSSYSMICADILGFQDRMTDQNMDSMFHPNVKCISDILKENGYKNLAIFGAPYQSCQQGNIFSSHGFSKSDIYSSSDYSYSFDWVRDYVTIDFAKEQLAKISKRNQPFFTVVMTLDTHSPGLICPYCPKIANRQLNSIMCSDRQVSQFIEWIKQQPFYEDTVVMLQGDHELMYPDLEYRTQMEGYSRTLFNAILNSKLVPEAGITRNYSVFDVGPTLLAAAGATIKGDRLGLGVNLFSKEKPLLEKYNFSTADDELNMENLWYINNILQESVGTDLRVTVKGRVQRYPSKFFRK